MKVSYAPSHLSSHTTTHHHAHACRHARMHTHTHVHIHTQTHGGEVMLVLCGACLSLFGPGHRACHRKKCVLDCLDVTLASHTITTHSLTHS
jgi:hypothetical protein